MKPGPSSTHASGDESGDESDDSGLHCGADVSFLSQYAQEREVIFPLAQQKIEIDLDDGVKKNYPEFGTALKKIVGLS